MLVRYKKAKKTVETVWIVIDAVPNDACKVRPEEILDTWTPVDGEGYTLVVELENGVKEFKVTVQNRHLWKLLEHLHRRGYLGMVDLYAPIPIGD